MSIFRDVRNPAQSSAMAGVLAPCLAFAVSCLLRPQPGAKTIEDKTYAILSAVFIVGMVLFGLAASITALVQMRKYGRQGVLGRSIVGLVLNGLLISVFILGFVAAIATTGRRAQNEAELKKLDQKVNEMTLQTRERFAKQLETGEMADPAAALDEMTESFNDASKNVTGPEANVIKATNVVMGQMKPVIANYHQTLSELNDCWGDLGRLQSPDEIDAALQKLKAFEAANEDLARFMANYGDTVRIELLKHQVPPEPAERIAAKAHASTHPDLSAKIRETDRQMITGIRGILTLLKERLGAWNYDTGSEQLTFDRDEDSEQFNSHWQFLETTTQTQAALQREALERMNNNPP